MEAFIDNILLIFLAIFLVAFLFLIFNANFAYENYDNYFKEIQTKPYWFTGNGYDFAVVLNSIFFGGKVKIGVDSQKEIKANACYVPSKHMVVLSKEIAEKCGKGVAGIVAHEFGHAHQGVVNPEMIIKNFKLTKAVKVLGVFVGFLLIAFAVCAVLGQLAFGIICGALIFVCFCTSLALKFSTIKIEKDASEKALKLLSRLKNFTEQDIKDIKKLLTLAKKTYTADFIGAMFFWTGLVRKSKLF